MNIELKTCTDEISRIIKEWEQKLMSLPEEVISQKRNNQNRNIRQILGHLIDSASNNHQRIIRLQYNECLDFPDYRQDNDLWIALQDYEHTNWNNLIQLWKYYNLHIIQIIEATDKSKFTNYWFDFEKTKVTLYEMIIGYPEHLKLHMNEINELLNK